ncbi:MAG: ATP-binding protein [Devosia sp.]
MSTKAKLLREKIAAGAAPVLRAMDANEVVIGIDILELLSSAMYVDPMSVYREYIQNAADAVDDARRSGMLGPDEPGRVDIELDPVARSVSIRDNGAGIAWSKFVRRLTAVGASAKRGAQARGFRGVGRLAGLGYAQELVFRSRVAGEARVSEMRWDCRKLRALLRSHEAADLSALIAQVVTVGRVDAAGWPERFFQAEMRGIIRLKADRLMDPTAIEEYLGQVAPVPFSPQFPFSQRITEKLDGLVAMGCLHIHVAGQIAPIHRPFQDGFAIDEIRQSHFNDIEFFEVPAVDGGFAAVGWVLHHDYEGAIPNAARIKGLRLRSGNVQVGDAALLEELFPETRFNSWSVGEVHIVDRRIVPNGRRDHFEQNTHYANLLNHLAPIAREISKRCRNGSVRRKLLRDFSMYRAAGNERMAILEQGAVGAARREQLIREVHQLKDQLHKIVVAPALLETDSAEMNSSLAEFGTRLLVIGNPTELAEPLAELSSEQRPMYEHMFDLIYSCSTNRIAAKALIDRIIEKIV